MIISFNAGTGGWANYVLNGTNANPRDKDKIEVIDGDPFFVEKIASQNKFSGEYYSGVLSAEKKLSNDEMKQIYEEFRKELFVGLQDDEYAISAVIHQDTDYTHVQFIVPKQNLLTGQHLQLHMFGIDTKRMDLIADYIALKHGLKTKAESKATIKTTKEYSFEKQRAERGQKPFTFTLVNRKAKAETEQKVQQLLKNNIKQYNSLNEMKQFIEQNTNLKVTNSGYDRKKDFHYITVADENGKKMRIKGEMFTESFFEQMKIRQYRQIVENYKPVSDRERLLAETRAKLNKENEKRYKVVQKLFRHGRERAKAETELQQLQQELLSSRSRELELLKRLDEQESEFLAKLKEAQEIYKAELIKQTELLTKFLSKFSNDSIINFNSLDQKFYDLEAKLKLS